MLSKADGGEEMMTNMASIERNTHDHLDKSSYIRALFFGSRGLRRIHNIGVAALARQLGLSAPHVSQVLSGQRTSRRVIEAAREAGVVSLEARP